MKKSRWQKLKLNIEPKGRYGHTMNSFGNGLIIFGGAQHFNYIRKERICLNDVMYFNSLTNDLDTIPTWGDIPQNRRNHASVLIGKTLIIYGGADKTGIFMNSMH